MTNKFNSFHIVEVSPWPLIASSGALAIVTAGLIFINNINANSLAPTFAIILIIAFSWWRDVHRESTNQGNHTPPVINGINTGIVLFIASEILFFVSFFWSFFHSSVSPTVEIGQSWPPIAICSFNPISIPLLNTIILLSSGVTITWSHHEIINNSFNNAKNALEVTISLGLIFTALQGFEYSEAPFSIPDSVFGSTFFIATGFHGLHVLIGTAFLWVSLSRFNNISSSQIHIVGFECAAWYWHFVDVVWLFLYSILYWWGA